MPKPNETETEDRIRPIHATASNGDHVVMLDPASHTPRANRRSDGCKPSWGRSHPAQSRHHDADRDGRRDASGPHCRAASTRTP